MASYGMRMHGGKGKQRTLSMTITPVGGTTIPDTTPLGTTVATMSATYSDGSIFYGGFEFVSPNFDNGGIYAIRGNELIINPNGPGVGSQGGNINHVSIDAVGNP